MKLSRDNHLPIVILLLVLALAVSGCAQQARPAEPEPPPVEAGAEIPMTVSDEARQILMDATGSEPLTIDEISPESIQSLREQMAVPPDMREATRNATGVSVAEDEFAGVPVVIITPDEVDPAYNDTIFLFFHGGAWMIGEADASFLYRFANISGVRIYSVDYRLMPEHPYPAGLEDCYAVYEELLKEHNPENIAIAGNSAGGELVLATVLKARGNGTPMPATLGLMSPCVDLTGTSDSIACNEGIDPFLSWDGFVSKAYEAYPAGHDPTDPLISPIYANYSEGFPPTIITTGTRDLLLSESCRLYRVMKRDGVEVELNVWEGMWHVFEGSAIPESEESFQDIATFLKARVAG